MIARASTTPIDELASTIGDTRSRLQTTELLAHQHDPASLAGFRNVIINGDFRINQRGFTSTSTDGAYGFDRSVLNYNGGTVTHSAQAFTPGSPAEVGYEAQSFARIVTSGQSAGVDYAILRQYIEDVRTLAGATVTVSFWAKAASGTPKVSVELSQDFGTGGSPSARVNNNVGFVTLSTSWQRYSLTVTLPTLAGEVLGTTANTSFLMASLWVSAGTTWASRANSIGIQSNTFDFWGVQVERGPVATSFEQRPIGTELALCQRYYQVVIGAAVGGPLNNIAWLGASFGQKIPYEVQPRLTPIATWGHNVMGDGLILPYAGAAPLAPVAGNVLVYPSHWRAQAAGSFVYFDIVQGVIFNAEF